MTKGTPASSQIIWFEGKVKQQEEEIERLRVENIQMRFALGYPMPADLERHILPSNPFKCGTCTSDRIQDLKNDVRFYQAKLKQIQENMPTYKWKETVSLPDRLRAMASMMNAGAAWGFCGESLFLEQAADLLEGKNKA